MAEQMTLSNEQLEEQLELLSQAIYSNSLGDWAYDFQSLLTTHRISEQVERNIGDVK